MDIKIAKKCVNCEKELTNDEVEYLDNNCCKCESNTDWHGPQYQCREIGESGWSDCSKEWFDHCSNSPLHDTRIPVVAQAGLQ